MLKVQFDGDVLGVRPEGPITRDDVATLTRAADEYLTGHSKITGVMVETRTFPGFASVSAFAEYARFIADHHAVCGASHWSPTRRSRRSRSSWPIMSSAWRCGTILSPRVRRHWCGSGPEGMTEVG